MGHCGVISSFFLPEYALSFHAKREKRGVAYFTGTKKKEKGGEEFSSFLKEDGYAREQKRKRRKEFAMTMARRKGRGVLS